MVRGLIRRVQAITGIYDDGFRTDSVLGVLLPVAFVVLVGGLGALLVIVLD